MDCNEIEAEYFEFTEQDSARFQEMLGILDRMLRDKQLGIVKSRDHHLATIMIRAEGFEQAFLLLQRRLSLHNMQALISFRLIRDKGQPKRTEYKIEFGSNGQTSS